MKHISARLCMILLCGLLVVGIGLRPAMAAAVGDVNADGTVNTDDAVYLLLHVMFGSEDYPISAGALTDFDGSDHTNTDDAVYLLLHVMFGAEDYPICDHRNTESVVVPGTCKATGYTEITCKDCSYSYQTNPTPKGDHTWTSMLVSEAAVTCGAKGNYGISKYRYLDDVMIDACPTCGCVDYTTVCSAYTPEEETAIMLELIKPIREAWFRESTEGYFTDEELAEFIEEYKHVPDQTCIDHAVRRAKEIVKDYSHNGAPYGCAENITEGANTIKSQFNGWKNSQGHYENMIKWAYPYAGYARYIVGDPVFETIKIYGVQIFGYYDKNATFVPRA